MSKVLDSVRKTDEPPGRESAGSTETRRALLAAALPGVLLSTLLTAWHYSSKPMWRDEWFTYSTVERPFTGMVSLLTDRDGGLAGFYLVMHAWMLMGDSVAWMRVPAAVCTVLVAALTALVGRRVGGPAVGVVSGLLVALVPTVIDHAQEARAYPLVLAAVTATCLAALRYQDRPSANRWAALSAAGFLAAALHPLPGAPAIAGIFLGLLLRPGPAGRWRILVAGVPAGLVAVALVTLGFVQQGVADTANGGGIRQAVNLRFLLAPGWGLLLAMLTLSALSLVALRHRRGPLVLLLAWIMLPLLSLVVLISLGSFFKPRYASSIVPAAAVLIAVGVVVVATAAARMAPSRYRPFSRTGAVLLITLALLVPLVPYAARTVESPFRTDDPRAATRALFAGYRSGDAVVYSGTLARGLTEHYAPAGERVNDPLLVRSPLASDTIAGRELPIGQAASAVEDYERLWVVGTLSGPGDRWNSQERVDTVTTGREITEDRTFGRYRLQLWTASGR